MADEKQNRRDRPYSKALEHKKAGIDESQNVKRASYALYAVCALLFAIDPFVHKHGPFNIEHIWGFYAFCGLIASLVLAIAAKILPTILMKPEDYYDR